MPKPKVCIIYGLAEGPKIAKRLIKSLTEQGFGLTNNPETADALIVHSGGQYFLPPQIQSKIVLLAGPCNGYIRESRFLTQMQKSLHRPWPLRQKPPACLVAVQIILEYNLPL